MSKSEVLDELRKEYPDCTIHEALKYRKNKYGWYDIEVDMEGALYGTTIRYTLRNLSYPLEEVLKHPRPIKPSYFDEYPENWIKL